MNVYEFMLEHFTLYFFPAANLSEKPNKTEEFYNNEKSQYNTEIDYKVRMNDIKKRFCISQLSILLMSSRSRTFTFSLSYIILDDQ